MADPGDESIDDVLSFLPEEFVGERPSVVKKWTQDQASQRKGYMDPEDGGDELSSTHAPAVTERVERATRSVSRGVEERLEGEMNTQNLLRSLMRGRSQGEAEESSRRKAVDLGWMRRETRALERRKVTRTYGSNSRRTGAFYWVWMWIMVEQLRCARLVQMHCSIVLPEHC